MHNIHRHTHHSGTVWVNRGLSFYAQNLQLSSAATQTRHITSTVLLTLQSSNQCSVKAVIEAVSLLQYTIPSEVILLPGVPNHDRLLLSHRDHDRLVICCEIRAVADGESRNISSISAFYMIILLSICG